MKKKTIAAFLTLALVWSISACGVAGAAETGNSGETVGTEDHTDQEEASKDAADTDSEEGTDKASEETSDSASKEETKKVSLPEGFGDRLVSVDSVDKYIKLGEYKGIALEKPEINVTDEQVEEEIGYRLALTMEEVTDSGATAQNSDTVTINFVGTKDGIAFDGGTADNYELTLGQGGMIQGFEEGIVGMKKGETKDLNLTFPEDYYEESLAGQDVVFQITVQKIQRVPELDDAWVAANSEAKTVDEYRELIKKELLENAEREAEYSMQITAWNTVSADAEVVEYPEIDIENAKAEFEYQLMMYAGDTELSLEEFLESQGYSIDDFNEQCRQYAESKVKQNLIVQGIMDAEGISWDDEEGKKIQEDLLRDYNVTELSELIDVYGQTAVYEALGFMRVEKYLVDQAAITFEVVDADADTGAGEEAFLEEDSDMEDETEEADSRE